MGKKDSLELDETESKLPKCLDCPKDDLDRQDLILAYISSGLHPRQAALKAGYSDGTLYQNILASVGIQDRLGKLSVATQRYLPSLYALMAPRLYEYDFEHLTDPRAEKVRDRVAKISGLLGPDVVHGPQHVTINLTQIGSATRSWLDAGPKAIDIEHDKE